jgi:flagellar hook-length control protein FliK
MENISIAKALFSQGVNAIPGADLASLLGAGMADTGGQFGALLTQQLQQTLGQGTTDEVSPGMESHIALGVTATQSFKDVDAATLVDVSGQLSALMGGAFASAFNNAELKASDVEAGNAEVENEVFLPQTGQLGANASEPALGVGKDQAVAVKDGKKLPPDLPVASKSSPDSLADLPALASMVAAQFASGTHQPAPQSRESVGETTVMAEGRTSVVGSVPGQEIPAKAELSAPHSNEAHAEVPAVRSGEAFVPAQTVPQTFAALMTERVATSTSPAAIPVLEIPQRIDSGQWGSGLGDKVVWMVGSQTQGAELRLNPPALGPLEVRVSMSDGQATLSFMTPHAPVREALEAAAPRLREMLGDSGISLGNVSVNVGTFAQQQPGSQEHSQQKSSTDHWLSTFNEGDDNVDPAAPIEASVRYLRDGGMVDLFA